MHIVASHVMPLGDDTTEPVPPPARYAVILRSASALSATLTVLALEVTVKAPVIGVLLAI